MLYVTIEKCSNEKVVPLKAGLFLKKKPLKMLVQTEVQTKNPAGSQLLRVNGSFDSEPI